MQLTEVHKEAIQYFKLGKIKEAIVCFENSINDKVNNELVYESLGICYMKIGDYKKSLTNFNKVINLNNKNERSINSILELLNFIKPKNFKENFILNTNEKILSLNQRLSGTVPNELIIKNIFRDAVNYVNKHFGFCMYECNR